MEIITQRFWKKILLTLAVIFILPGGLAAQEKSEKDRWKSSVGVSYVTISGNSHSQTVSLSADANRKGDNNELELKTGLVYGKSEGDTVSEYWYANGKHDHNISKKTYVPTKLSLEGNKLSGYNYRFGAYSGVGYRFLEGTHELKGEVGPGYLYEDRIGDDDRSFLSGRAYAVYKWQITENTAFSQDAEFLNNFEDSDDYRVNTDTALVVKISEWISLKTGVVIKYVNLPPPDNERTDIFTNTSLVFTF